MIVRAVALPGTPLLVPGVAGAAEVLAQSRDQVLDALRELVRDAQRVVVLDCGSRGGGDRRGPMRPGLEAVGVDPRWWGWTPRDAPADLPVAGVAGSVALLALDAAGWHGPVETVELGRGTGPEAAVGFVHEVLAEPRTGLVVVTGAPASVTGRAARPASTGPTDEPVERRVLEGLGDAWEATVGHATGEYEGRVYDVVRFGETRGRGASLPGRPDP